MGAWSVWSLWMKNYGCSISQLAKDFLFTMKRMGLHQPTSSMMTLFFISVSAQMREQRWGTQLTWNGFKWIQLENGLSIVFHMNIKFNNSTPPVRASLLGSMRVRTVVGGATGQIVTTKWCADKRKPLADMLIPNRPNDYSWSFSVVQGLHLVHPSLGVRFAMPVFSCFRLSRRILSLNFLKCFWVASPKIWGDLTSPQGKHWNTSSQWPVACQGMDYE